MSASLRSVRREEALAALDSAFDELAPAAVALLDAGESHDIAIRLVVACLHAHAEGKLPGVLRRELSAMALAWREQTLNPKEPR